MGTGGSAGTYYGYGGVLGQYIKNKAGIDVTVVATRAYFDFILRRSDGEVYASGTGIWTPVEIATGRPVPIETICELRIPDGATGIRHPKLRFGSQGELVFEKEHLTTLGDMDFNKHVGNRAYINHAIDDFPNDIIENEYVSSLAIKFIRQTFIGDTLVSRCFRNGDDGRDYNEIVEPITPQMRSIDSIYPQAGLHQLLYPGGCGRCLQSRAPLQRLY